MIPDIVVDYRLSLPIIKAFIDSQAGNEHAEFRFAADHHKIILELIKVSRLMANSDDSFRRLAAEVAAWAEKEYGAGH